LNYERYKIQWGKQGKHLKDHKNYEVNRKMNILEHSDPEKHYLKTCVKNILFIREF